MEDEGKRNLIEAEHEAYQDLFRQLSEYERKELAGELVPAASLETARKALECYATHTNWKLPDEEMAFDSIVFCCAGTFDGWELAEHALAQIANPSAALEERDRAVRIKLLDKMSDIEVLLPIEDFMGTKRDLTAKFHIALIEKARREFGLEE